MKNYKLLKVIFLLGVFYLMSCDSKENECDDLAFRTSEVPLSFDFKFNPPITDLSIIEVFCHVNDEINECKNRLELHEELNSLFLDPNITKYTLKTPAKTFDLEFTYKTIEGKCFTTFKIDSIVVNGTIFCEDCDSSTKILN